MTGLVKNLLALWLLLLGAAQGKSLYTAEPPLGNFSLNSSEISEDFPPETQTRIRENGLSAYDCTPGKGYCHNDPVNKVDVLGTAEVVTTTPGGNDVLVNDETSFWLVYNMMADAGLVGKLDAFGAKPTFTDAMLVAGKLGGTVKNYPKAWPWAATGAASPNDLWIMPGSATLPGNSGGYFDSFLTGFNARQLAQGKGFFLDAVDVRAIQAAGEATSSYPWGSLSDREAQILGDRSAVLTWLDTPILTVGGGDGRDEYQWGGTWSMLEPAPGPRGCGYAMGTTPFGTPRMIRNILAVEVATAGLAKGFEAVSMLGASGNSVPQMVRVTSWAEEGITPDLNPGRWVQLGDPTKVNFWRTGLPGPKGTFIDEFPYLKIQRSKVPFTNSITDDVPAASLQWPPSLDKWRGLFGQRKLKGGP